MAIAGRVLLVALAVLAAAVPAGSSMTPKGAVAAPATPAGTPPQAGNFRSARDFTMVAEPVRLRIPAVHVDTGLQRLARKPDGTIAVPDSPTVAGWYQDGPRPGQPGPAVLLGHVDSMAGPGVFFRIYQLTPGEPVYVDRADGSTATFRVVSVANVPKTEFPTAQVYSPTLQPSLQLVTCGGSFDSRVHSYRDNVIVYTVPS